MKPKTEPVAAPEPPALAADLSRFLPADFDARAPLALIAGQGLYPQLVAERARAAGLPLRLLAFEGETPEPLFESFASAERARVKVGQIGKAIKALRGMGARYALMAGKITPGKLFRGLQPDLRAIQILTSLKERNADTLFGAVVREIEAAGIEILDARCFMDNDLAREGSMTGGKRQIDPDSLAHGVRIAKEVSRLDIGQGVVVARGTVLAVEGFEGTSAMLERAGTFGAKEALFVKTSKPGQDFRFDVPVLGQETLEVMRRGKLKAAALEADRALILDREATVAQARKMGIELLGYAV